jgi:hypothetical protein
MTIIYNPPNDRVIDQVWVVLSEDPNGKNGICADIMPFLGSVPMVTGSPKGLELFKQRIDEVARRSGKPVKIYRFVRAEVVAEAK